MPLLIGWPLFVQGCGEHCFEVRLLAERRRESLARKVLNVTFLAKMKNFLGSRLGKVPREGERACTLVGEPRGLRAGLDGALSASPRTSSRER